MAQTVPIRTAFITGAASGIGLGITKHLLSLPDVQWRVIMGDINEEAGTKLAAELASSHGAERITFIKVDTSSWEENVAAFKQAYEWSKQRLDVFAPNAGVAQKVGIFNISPDDELTPPNLTTVNVNLVGPLYGTQNFLYYVRKTRKTLQEHSTPDNDLNLTYNPKLVFTASVTGLYKGSFVPIYAATKHGIVGLTRSIADGLAARDGLYVNALAPSWVDTNIFSEESKAKCPNEWKTPVATIAQGFCELIAGVEYEGPDESKRGVHGHVLESSATKLYHREMTAHADEITTKVMSFFGSQLGEG